MSDSGEPDSERDAPEEDRYIALAARAEDEDYAPIEQMDKLATGQSTTSEELTDLVRGSDVLLASTTPAGATEGRATEEDLQDLIALGGRASLGGPPGSGPSRKRQVRLPHDLDALLAERAHRDQPQPERDHPRRARRLPPSRRVSIDQEWPHSSGLTSKLRSTPKRAATSDSGSLSSASRL